MSELPSPPQLPRSNGPPPPSPVPGADGSPSDLSPHRGVLILILGICSWVTGCFVLGIIAWAMGNRDLLEMEEGRMDPEGMGLTRGGRIAAMVHVILVCIGLLVMLIGLIGFGVYLFEAGR